MPQDPLKDKPGVSPANRSLERGIDILRAFRPGSDLLANGDLAERTGLSRATVSRLTQTLVGAGLLQLDPTRRAYRLAPAVLSFAHALRGGSPLLQAAAPHMAALAESQRLNVGLAAPDRDEMVYLESIRYNRKVALRKVVSGQRVPMELTSLGRAYLATTTPARRATLATIFQARNGSAWPALAQAIDQAVADVARQGWCAAAWQPQVVALACPLQFAGGSYVLNLSLTTEEPVPTITPRLAPALLALRAQVLAALG